VKGLDNENNDGDDGVDGGAGNNRRNNRDGLGNDTMTMDDSGCVVVVATNWMDIGSFVESKDRLIASFCWWEEREE